MDTETGTKRDVPNIDQRYRPAFTRHLLEHNASHCRACDLARDKVGRAILLAAEGARAHLEARKQRPLLEATESGIDSPQLAEPAWPDSANGLPYGPTQSA